MNTAHTTDLTVANTILGQLGGARFTTMTGARDFVAAPYALHFSIPRAKRGINKVRVMLSADDTYVVTFFKYARHTWTCTEIHAVSGVFADNLQAVFTDVTGLFARL